MCILRHLLASKRPLENISEVIHYRRATFEGISTFSEKPWYMVPSGLQSEDG